MRVLTLEMDYPLMSRDDFRGVFKRELGHSINHLPYDWTSNLIAAFGEIVKNFYDHANKKGVIVVTVDTHEMTFEAYDFGPGKKDVPWVAISKENCGLGLKMIEGALDGLRLIPGVTSCNIEITTVDHFHYKGKITY